VHAAVAAKFSARVLLHADSNRLTLQAGNSEIDGRASLTFRAQHLQVNQQDYFGQGQFTTANGDRNGPGGRG
jgi:hypothetical protein